MTRSLNLASKQTWKKVRRVQGYPAVTVIVNTVTGANNVAGIVGTVTPTSTNVQVTIHLATDHEIRSSLGILEMGDLRISGYYDFKVATTVVYSGYTYKCVHVTPDPSAKRRLAFIRRVK